MSFRQCNAGERTRSARRPAFRLVRCSLSHAMTIGSAPRLTDGSTHAGIPCDLPYGQMRRTPFLLVLRGLDGLGPTRFLSHVIRPLHRTSPLPSDSIAFRTEFSANAFSLRFPPLPTLSRQGRGLSLPSLEGRGKGEGDLFGTTFDAEDYSM